MKREEDGWFFAEWEPDGEPEYAGFELDVCTDCHGSRNDRGACIHTALKLGDPRCVR